MPEPVRNRDSSPWLRRLLLGGFIVLLLAGVLEMARLLRDTSVVLLQDQGDAKWLRVDLPLDPGAKFDPSTATTFQTTLRWASHSTGETLRIMALRRAVVRVDGKTVFDSGPNLQNWKTVYSLPLPADFPSGQHLLQITVTNTGGPSLLRVDCPELNLHSNDQWLASNDGLHWNHAATANRQWDVNLPPRFQSTVTDVVRLSPMLIGLFLVGCAFSLPRPGNKNWGQRLRWLLLGAWLVLGINNLMKVPLGFGFDADEQMRYIRYVADHASLPRPDAGWQFFQAPLYYILSALLDRLLMMLGIASGTVAYLLRMIPLICGGMLVEICYRSARLVFPDRPDLQAIATTIGGLLPVNIYMSQAVSNEPLAAVFSGLIVLQSLRLLTRPKLVHSCRTLVISGAFIGTALLSKISAVIWLLPFSMVMTTALLHCRASPRQWWRALVMVGAPALCVSGWFFIRNLWLIGMPIIVMESSVSQTPWWQDPGYRMPNMFCEFGHVFARPIYNGVDSVWDSLYGSMWGNGLLSGQPPWNFGLMSCGLWLAIIPMIAIALGILRAIRNRNPALLFAAFSIACFIAAILHVYLTLPIYSCAKASYLLGTAPCIGLLAANGFEKLRQNRWPRILTTGAIFCWAVAAYLTYFAV